MHHHDSPFRGRASAAVVAAASAVVLLLTGCAGPAEETTETPPSAATEPESSSTAATPNTTASSSPSASTPPEPTSAPPEEAPAGPSLEVGVQGDEVTPNAAEIDLAVGEPLRITFDTDRGGELHVHSKPEQYVEFEAGRSTRELIIQTPGSVEIEEHDTEAVVAVVRVR